MRNKVTQEHIESRIVGVDYTVLPDGRTTICTLSMANGYTVHGQSSVVDKTGFDASKGRHFAYEDAINKVWPLEGYLLAEERHTALDRQKVNWMTFGEALDALKAGRKCTRRGWNGKGLWVELQLPDDGSKMTQPYIYINYPPYAKTTPGARVPWWGSQTDMLAEDWEIVE